MHLKSDSREKPDQKKAHRRRSVYLDIHGHCNCCHRPVAIVTGADPAALGCTGNDLAREGIPALCLALFKCRHYAMRLLELVEVTLVQTKVKPEV